MKEVQLYFINQLLISIIGHVDRREDHEGRVREFAHVSGIWPTHVYITGK